MAKKFTRHCGWAFAEAMQSRTLSDYAKHRSRSHAAVIRVYDAAGNVIEMHKLKSDFKEW